MKIICDNIDNIITTELRTKYLPRGVVSSLYHAVRRSDTLPVSYQIAEALKDRIHKSKDFKVGIFTGVWHPEYFPNGENDGPIGSVVLGRALYLGGAKVTYCVEKEVGPVIKKLCEFLNIPANIVSVSRESEEKNEELADKLDSAIFIEKIGSCKEGKYHFATGGTRQNQDAPLESMLEKMKHNGKLTIGIGDNGNEVGFGKIHDEAKMIVPFNEKVTKMSTEYLLPSSVSNIGAYGITASLALLMNNLKMLHTPEDEIGLIRICTELNCRDGGFGKAHDFVDGISAKTVASIVGTLKEMVSLYYTEEKRPF